MPEDTSRTIRTFIALELTDEARAELARIIEVLKKAEANVKWTDPKSVHLTLKFLGNIPEEKVARIAERLKEVASITAPFEIILDGVGVFPGWNNPRVLWVGIGKGADQVKLLAAEVDKTMVQEGFEAERRTFSPHLTLGRIKREKKKNAFKPVMSSIIVKPVSISVSQIILFKSNLTPLGAVYEPLITVAFTQFLNST